MHKPKKAQNGGVGFSFMYNDRSMEFSIYCHVLFRTSGVDNPICQTCIMCVLNYSCPPDIRFF